MAALAALAGRQQRRQQQMRTLRKPPVLLLLKQRREVRGEQSHPRTGTPAYRLFASATVGARETETKIRERAKLAAFPSTANR